MHIFVIFCRICSLHFEMFMCFRLL